MVASLPEAVVTSRKALLAGLSCALFELLGAQLLDALGLVQGLLAPHGAQLFLLVPLAATFYAARLATYFVLPVLVAATLLQRVRRASGMESPESRLRRA
jgi:hypothetical protein